MREMNAQGSALTFNKKPTTHIRLALLRCLRELSRDWLHAELREAERSLDGPFDREASGKMDALIAELERVE